ncbi:DUF4031 domain-containing protein [Knoellia sp. CPCC 206435]|uniref:DUF4031 domain-containing protein n=1 Tax=Knoellia terrae TaxID=3404797 RepID=UPI003B43AA5F
MLLIDPPAWPAHGRLWSHLVSDTSVEELHTFAARVGIPRRGFEGDHYDVPEERYAAVVAAGAQPIGGRELLARLRDSGLRISKRRHERVLQSTADAPWLPPGGRADVITSRQDDVPPNTVVVRLAVTGPRGLLVERRPDGELDLPSRRVAPGTAEQALRALVASALGSVGRVDPTLIGYVRNVVRQPDEGYPWPTPFACFAVHALAANGSAAPAGEWVRMQDGAARLGHRHWWPLVALHLGLISVDAAHD